MLPGGELNHICGVQYVDITRDFAVYKFYVTFYGDSQKCPSQPQKRIRECVAYVSQQTRSRGLESFVTTLQ